MKVSFTGSHSVGKTTLMDELKKQETLKDFTFMTELTRSLPKDKINENGDDEIQLAIMKMHEDNIKLDNCVLDRGVFDGLAYTAYLHTKGKVSDDMFFHASEVLAKIAPLYDLVFYVPIEFPIVPDGVRSEDETFRKYVDLIIRMTTEAYQEHFKLVCVKGDINTRVTTCLNAVKEVKCG